MFTQDQQHTDTMVWDNEKQNMVVHSIYRGSEQGYVPVWDRNENADTLGHDYVSVVDGITALLGV